MIENDIKLLEHCVLDLQHRVQVLEKKLKQTQRRVTVLECKADRKIESPTDIHDLTDCDFCKDRNCKDCEGGKDEPQTYYKKWDVSPKVDLPTGEITTCVSVLASAFEEASQAERERMSDESRRTDKKTK